MIPQEQKNRLAFWILKRHTSLTAWERAYRAFMALFEAMERVRPQLPLYGTRYKSWTDWPRWDGLLDFKRNMEYCLGRLRQGDKKILAYSRAVPASRKTFEEKHYFIKNYYDKLIGYDFREGFEPIEYIPVYPEQGHIMALAFQSAKLYVENIEIPYIDSLQYKSYVPANRMLFDDYPYLAMAPP